MQHNSEMNAELSQTNFYKDKNQLIQTMRFEDVKNQDTADQMIKDIFIIFARSILRGRMKYETII